MKNGDTSIHSTGLTKEEMEGVGDKFHQGLTKREYAAIKAMHGIVSSLPHWESLGYPIPSDPEIATQAISAADALLKALEEEE